MIGFLPSIYAQAGIGAKVAGYLSALAAAVNIIGNVVAGRLLHRGWPPWRLLLTGYLAMGCGALLAFAGGAPPELQYLSVIVFSMVGGLIPSTLFSLAVRFAPNVQTVSASVGWMQQWSALGQFCGPPLVAWVATRSGGWQSSGWVMASCSLAGVALSWRLRLRERH
jgi:predicted MFS family arabinose efflux permease